MRVLRPRGGRFPERGKDSPAYEALGELVLRGENLAVEAGAAKTHLCAEGGVGSGTWLADMADRSSKFKELWAAAECVRREAQALRERRVLVRVGIRTSLHCPNVRRG